MDKMYDIGQLVSPGELIIITGMLVHGDELCVRPGKGRIPLEKMTRGNQRELARQKNMKKQAEQKKGRDVPEGMSVSNVKLLDAEIMRQKQQKALEKKQQEEEARLAALRASKAK